MNNIDFIDLRSQYKKIQNEIDEAISRTLSHGHYIMGPEVTELEKKLAKFCGAKHAITCSNGTDALALGLRAKNVSVNHAIFVPSFTFAATAEVVGWMGATPIFIDVLPNTFNVDPESLKLGISTAKKLGLIPYGVIAVDLFGQPADYASIREITNAENLWLMADGAQSFGADYQNCKVGCLGDMTTTSFFPAKPLGCYGDGGAFFTNDDELALIVKSLRVHGKGQDKYDNIRIGMNARLDTIQAAILIEKLKIFPEEINARNIVAQFYKENLHSDCIQPLLLENVTSTWAQYTVQLPKKVDRDSVINKLKEFGIPTNIYYVKPLHLQTAYQNYPIAGQKNLINSEILASRVLSLPMSPYLSQEKLEYIVEKFNTIF
ncbi:MAG: aminotransferase DegT [Francisellaceae bacterium]|nr:aminotransferase DegT [Francisellaceae bacterium]